jgi:DNA-binding CsgD family transcriptional regulator
MGIQLPQNHITLTSATDIKEICRPLEKLGITYFSFFRSFADGSHIRLSNNTGWTEHYYKREFYNVITKQVPDTEGNILWSAIDRYPLFHEASEYFDVDNGTVLVVMIDDVIERYFFGSTKENSQVNYIYLHKIDLLKRFILHFKECASHLINEAEKTKIILPKLILNRQDEEFYSDSLIQEFLNDIKIKKVCVRTQGQDFYITPNNAKILSLMKCGYTSKEISSEVGLKQKTVEIYRDNLKDKLLQFTQGNLLTIAKANSLLDFNLL